VPSGLCEFGGHALPVEPPVAPPVALPVPWSHEPEFLFGPPYGGASPSWPSESHGGLLGGGFGVPPPDPNARPGRMNIAETATAMAIGKNLFLICHPPSRLFSRASKHPSNA